MQVVELGQRALAVKQLAREAFQPRAALPAGRALATRLVAVKLHQVVHACDGVGPLGDHGDAAGAEHGSDTAHRVDPQGDVEDALAVPRVHGALRVRSVDGLPGEQDGRRRSARNDAENAAVVDDAPTDFEDELVQGRPDRQLDDRSSLDVAVYPVEAHAAVAHRVQRRELAELFAAHPEGRWNDGDRLEIVDGGGAAERPGVGWKGRLHAGLTAAPLDRVEHRCLFAADVRAGARVDVDLYRVVFPEGALSEVPPRPRLLNGALEAGLGEVKLVAHVDVRHVRADAVARDDATLDASVGVTLHQRAILVGAGLALVGVDHQVVRLRAERLRHEAPLHAHREAGSTAPADVGLLRLGRRPALGSSS